MENRESFTTAILSQPQWMRRAAELAAGSLGHYDVAQWRANETVAVIGMGSSTNAGAVFCEALRAAGVRAVNIDAAAVEHYPAGFRPGDHVIVVSESGRSPEPIAAAQKMGAESIVVTNDVASPVASLSARVIPLGGFTDSGVYTIGYTTTLVALAAIAQAAGVCIADPLQLAGVAESALADFYGRLAGLGASLNEAAVLDIVGQATGQGSAQAAALLFRESCGLATAAHQTIQYLHGPMESCGVGSAVLLFGDAREKQIAAQLRDAGVLVARMVASPGESEDGVYRTSVAAGSGYEAAVAEVVFAQCVAAELAALRGRDVGHFKYPQNDTKLPKA